MGVSVLVIGSNPEELMSAYDSNRSVDKYMKYRYADASKLKQKHRILLKGLLANPTESGLSAFQVDVITHQLEELEKESEFDFYSRLTEGLSVDADGNAWCTDNPHGKWRSKQIGGDHCPFLTLHNGENVFQANIGDVNFGHMCDGSIYHTAWELVKEGRQAMTDVEKRICENITLDYLNNFRNKEEYVAYNSAFWTGAVVNENGWKEMSDAKSTKDWVLNFHSSFLQGLDNKTLLTIFEINT